MKADVELCLNHKLLEIESQLKHSHEKGRAEAEARVSGNIETNSNAFYTFAKESASVTYKIGPLYVTYCSLTPGPQVISKLLIMFSYN